MAVNLVVAVTDGDWFEMLRQQPDLDAVNFWAPSARGFNALVPGELFLFKLHAPRNFIVGGGTFTRAYKLPCSLAWETFKEANGAHGAEEMRARIAHYLNLDQNDRSDFEIGCRILSQPFFFDEDDWIPVPANWAPNIVSFKVYNTDDEEGIDLWNSVHDRMMRLNLRNAEAEARFGTPQLIEPRLGQQAFRILVTETYNRQCVVSGERTLPALEAAHIRPYSDGGQHNVQNGLLLRRDIHSLFDRGYVTVTSDLEFKVSDRIREEFNNGRIYYDLDGRRINDPTDSSLGPDRQFLEWHKENCFLD